jgi:DNA-directed RNA polymerase specialized sigma subunit
MKSTDLKLVANELSDVKKLLILIATKNKASQTEIGKLLGISDRQVRNLLSGK